MDYKNHVKYKNFILLGTSHISKESLDEVEYLVNNEKPDFIAIELDYNRYKSLLSGQKAKLSIGQVFHIGVRGYFFSVIASWAEKKLGELTGVPPGSEMKHAIMLAKKNKINIELIDQDIEITLKRFSKSLTWKEKLTFIGDIIKGIFIRKKSLEFDIRTVPSEKIIKRLILKVKKSYPSVYKVLITERNKVMAANLLKISEANPGRKILAVLGAGHIGGIVKLLKLTT